MTISRFVSPYGTYTFPTSPGDQEFSTNFKNLVTKVTRGIATNGGIDEYGLSRSPSDVGNVQFSIYLVSATRAGMQPLRDALNTMCEWGVGRLYDNLNGTERWCWARISSDGIAEKRHENTDLQQKVSLTFQVSDPFWYTTGNGVVWGAGTWGSSKFGGTSTGTAVTNSGTISVTNNGSAYTLARLSVKNASGATVYNPIIRRVVNGTPVDEVFYNGSIADGTQLDIDPSAHRVTNSGVSVISNFTFTHPDWMRLLPGTNSLTVNVTGAVTVYVRYYERYT